MRARDLFRFPVGAEIELKSENYTCILKTCVCKYDNARYHYLREKGSISKEGVVLSEVFESYPDEIDYNGNKIQFKRIHASTTVFGIHLGDENPYWKLSEFEIVPRGSFREFIRRTKTTQLAPQGQKPPFTDENITSD